MEDAIKVGSRFAGTKLKLQLKRSSTSKIKTQGTTRGYTQLQIPEITNIKSITDKNGKVLAYVLLLSPKGYIVVSPDTDINPIITYSTKSDFSFEPSPLNTLLHLVKKDMSLRLKAIALMPETLKRRNNLLWKALEEGGTTLKQLMDEGSSWKWGPWLETEWGQSYPYNKYCPLDPSNHERSLTGCVATAMGQIIFYWKYPRSVSFSCNDGYIASYKRIYIYENKDGNSGCSDDDHETLDFPPLDELNQMLQEIDYSIKDPSINDDIPALLFACGISVKMDYASYSYGGSAAYPSDAANALKNKFSYESVYFTDYEFNDEDFQTLKQNMKDGRPALLAISKYGTGGHAVVADGFERIGGVDYYHINFGWEGLCDGWYQLPEGLPRGYNAIDAAILNIFPGNEVNNPPIIDSFSASPTRIDPGESVTFACSGHDPDGGITRYLWDFDGDGSVDQETQTGQVTHNYQDEGVYKPSCTIEDSSGGFSKPAILTLEVRYPKPVVDSITANPTSGTAPLNVQLTCIAHHENQNTTITSYKWDFDGDGEIDETTQQDTTTAHYVNPGIYSPMCIAADEYGRESEPGGGVTVDVEGCSSPSCLSEALDNSGFLFETSGDAGWVEFYDENSYNGNCTKSGDIENDQISCLETCVVGPGTISFYWKVSSEYGYDKLKFYVDGSISGSISGSVDWTQFLQDLGDGIHHIKWCYEKDESISEGEDAGWIDHITYDGPIVGDMNGDKTVGTGDAVLLLEQLLGISQDPADTIPDARCDGLIDILDALTISRKSLNLPVDRWGCPCTP